MPDPTETDLVRRLRLEMRRKGLTDAGLAKKAGLNLTAVRDILKGRSISPRYKTVKALGEALGIGATALTSPLSESDYEKSVDSVSDLMQISVKEVDVRAAAGGGAVDQREE